jgi:predicted Holliday junction resolvase-like endonuclease
VVEVKRMNFEFFFLIVGIVIGAFVIYLIFSRRIASEIQKKSEQLTAQAEQRAEQISQRLFEAQRSQLESSIHQTYIAKLDEWKASTLRDTIISERADALQRARSVLKGKIGEQLAPLLPEFLALCNPSDARFIGSPIDYLIFKNMTVEEDKELPIEVILLDVKTGKSGLSKIQKRIQEAIENGRVRFHTLQLERNISESQESTNTTLESAVEKHLTNDSLTTSQLDQNEDSKYDPIIDKFLEGNFDLVKVEVKGHEADYLLSKLQNRVDLRNLNSKIEVHMVNNIVYLEKK